MKLVRINRSKKQWTASLATRRSTAESCPSFILWLINAKCLLLNKIILFLNNSIPSDFLAAYVPARLLFSCLPLFSFFLALSWVCFYLAFWFVVFSLLMIVFSYFSFFYTVPFFVSSGHIMFSLFNIGIWIKIYNTCYNKIFHLFLLFLFYQNN